MILLHRCEYLKIIDLLDSKIPRFLEKYPGYKIILFKFHYFNLIIQNKPSDEINNFLNKELFPLLNKYNDVIKYDCSDFKYLIDNPNILKTSFYQQIFENLCKIFESGLNLSLDWILWIEKEKDKNSPKAKNYYKDKDVFVKKIDTLIEYEKEIVKNSKETTFIKTHSFDSNLDKNLDIFHKILEENYINLEEQKSFDYSDFFPLELDKNKDYFCFDNKSLNDDVNNVIFENKNYLINYNFYNDKINNKFKNNNFLNNKNKNNYNKIKTSFNVCFNDSFSNNISTKDNKSNGSNESYKNTIIDLRKKKIKQFKFQILKRENVDKKILRKFKKFLKAKLKDKMESDVKNYININQFWPDYIKMNLMPPFYYDKEKIKFKSFNTKYLCWLFEHKYALELFNIFIKINHHDILKLIENAYNISKNSNDYILLKTYINAMPSIYGVKDENRVISYTSNIKQYEDEKNNNQINKEEIKNPNYEINEGIDNMIIENGYIYSKENIYNINNISSINVNNNLINNDYMNIINNNYKVDNINTFSNPQTFTNKDNTNNNMDINLKENEFNHNFFKEPFEDRRNNRQNFDKNIFNLF